MDGRTRWTDDRLDDMAKTLEKLETRQDTTQNVAAAVDLRVTEFERERRLGRDRQFALRLALATVALGQVAEITVLLLKVH